MNRLGKLSVNSLLLISLGFILTGNASLSLAQSPDSWTPKQPPSYVNRSASIALNGKIYVFGSDDPSLATSSFSRVYDPVADQWTALKQIPISVGAPSVASVGGLIYVVGGYNPDNGAIFDPSPNQVYDPSTNSWSPKSGPHVARAFGTAQAVGNKIYFIGGLPDGGSVSDANEQYDPITDTWSPMRSMPTARNAVASAIVGNVIYVIGGSSVSSAVSTVEAYDPSQNSWSKKASMLTARSEFGAASLNGKIYAFGGASAAGKGINEEYDPSSDAWVPRASIPVVMFGNTGAAVNGLAYSIGINRSDGSTQVNFAYNPPNDCQLDPSLVAALSNQSDPPQPSFGPPGTSCSTIDFGCALMTYSNMLISFDNPLLEEIPAVLDSDLITVNGYVDKNGNVPGCLLDPVKVPNAVDFLVEPSGSKSFAGTPSDPTLDTFINQHFCQNKERVILKLTEFVQGSTKPPGDHFVLVTGKNGSDWAVFDPGWRHAKPITALTSLQGHYSGFTTTSLKNGATLIHTFVVHEARAYDTTPLAGFSSLDITAFSPVELLVVDDTGRRLGHSLADGDVFEIPKGSYYRDFPLSLDDDLGIADGDPSGIKTAYISSPPAGSYGLQVTGTAVGTFLLRVRSVGVDRSVQEIRIPGVTSPSTTSTYQISYSSAPGFTLGVTRAITFQTTIDDINNCFQVRLIDNRGIANSLAKKVSAAQSADASAQQNILNAFINEVNAQSGKHITGIAPQLLIDDANLLLGQNTP